MARSPQKKQLAIDSDDDRTRYRNDRPFESGDHSSWDIPEASTADFGMGIPYTDKFTVRGFIGQGGTSRVLLGFDRRIGREVAIKELLGRESGGGMEDSAATEMTERFEREIEITGQLEHPGIVPVYEAGSRINGPDYYAMRYVRGKTLKEAIIGCDSLSPELSFAHRMKLLDNVIHVCDAIAFAHSKEVIHRDIKPENVVIGQFGETVVIDWGLAKILDRNQTLFGRNSEKEPDKIQTDDLTRFNSVFGTPRYMAPEQAGGKTGKFSDVYSLGALLFCILTGKPAYSGTLNEVINQLTSNQPTPSPRKVLPLVPAELSAICEKAMAKDPTKRFLDARELAEQLHAYRDGRLISTYAYTKNELLRRFVSRNTSLIVSVIIVMIAVLGGAVASVNYAIEANAAQARADTALVDVTALSQMAIRHSQEIAEVVETRLTDLAADMDETAKKLAKMDAGNSQGIQILLRNLHSRYPDIDHFMFIDGTDTVQEYSPGSSVKSGEMHAYDTSNRNWIHSNVFTSRLGRVFELGKSGLHLPVQSPILVSGEKIGRLVGLLRPTEFLSDLIFSVTPAGKVHPKAWLMQDDGLILYDNDPSKIGTNLYTNMQLVVSSSLQALGMRVKLEETGIGYYSLSRDGKKNKIDNVTAWDTIVLNGNLEWKTISYFEYQNR